MPEAFEHKVRARGVLRWRTRKMPNGEIQRCAVVRKKGPRGGRTVCEEPQKVEA
jgi:hypothetical protein